MGKDFEKWNIPFQTKHERLFHQWVVIINAVFILDVDSLGTANNLVYLRFK